MATVPRGCDTLRIERISKAPAEYRVSDRAGVELGKVTEEGYFLLLKMDGLTDLADVQSLLNQRFGKSSSTDELQAWFSELQDAGVLNTNDRAIRILTYLKQQGVNYRGSSADRRGPGDDQDENRREESRRDEVAASSGWFDYGIFLLNDGMLDEGLAVFEQMMESQPGDVRLHELTGHLRFLSKTVDLPEPTADRRDISWDAFDSALREMLDDGACPKCDLPLEVQLGHTNRCRYCGASFSTYVLGRAGDDRRRQSSPSD